MKTINKHVTSRRTSKEQVVNDWMTTWYTTTIKTLITFGPEPKWPATPKPMANASLAQSIVQAWQPLSSNQTRAASEGLSGECAYKIIPLNNVTRLNLTLTCRWILMQLDEIWFSDPGVCHALFQFSIPDISQSHSQTLPTLDPKPFKQDQASTCSAQRTAWSLKNRSAKMAAEMEASIAEALQNSPFENMLSPFWQGFSLVFAKWNENFAPKHDTHDGDIKATRIAFASFF